MAEKTGSAKRELFEHEALVPPENLIRDDARVGVW
jgi:hypothetical protein